jgi:predicted phosphate transport protein (TIGR00153 family)
MWLDRAIKWLLPREDHFYVLLQRGAQFAKDASALLVKCTEDADRSSRELTIKKLKEVEHEADRVIVEVYQELNRTFVTPIDRSDIYKLASELESITDAIYSTAFQIVVHAMEDLPAGSRELAVLVDQCCKEIYEAVSHLQSKTSHLDIRKRCKNIKSFEDQGDIIFRTQIAAMFKSESDAIRLLKHKEFLEGLEGSLDLCDDVGNVLSTVVIKNS